MDEIILYLFIRVSRIVNQLLHSINHDDRNQNFP